VAERNPKKVAILLPCLKFGGAERVALSLAKALEENNCRIEILLMSKEGEFLAEAEAKFRVVDLQCDKTYKLPIKILSYLWRNRPDALISSFWKLNLCSCVAKPLFPWVKLILWEHSPPSKSPNSPKWLYAISASVLYRLADKVVAVSTGVRDDIDRWTIGLRRKLIVIFNPANPPDPELIESSKARRVFEEQQIVSIGRLDQNKNHRLLIEAFALVAKERPVKLVILGEGSFREQLEQLCATLGLDERVKLLGYHPNPYAVLAVSDLLVVSSDREGLPGVIIEAMYCGLPVVSTDCGAGVEDILVGGKYGRVVPTGDKWGLARAIEAELKTARSSESQKKGAARFLPQIAAQQFLNAMQ
jgi:glycosyltransferase involved in cell wall biosynthesis